MLYVKNVICEKCYKDNIIIQYQTKNIRCKTQLQQQQKYKLYDFNIIR